MNTPSCNKALVSIRCYAYNQAPFIKDCLDGMLMQRTGFPFEIIIHDDASTDGTDTIIKDYEARYPGVIKALYEEENQYSKDGLRAVFDRMNSMAEGKYIALCEADDYWTDPLKLQKQVDFMESHPDHGLCYTKSVTKYESKGSRKNNPWGGPNESFKDLISKNTIPTATVLLRADMEKRYLSEIRPYDHGWLMGDYPKWLWFSHESKIRFMDEITCIYRARLSSASHAANAGRMIRFLYSTMDIALFMESHFAYPERSLVHIEEYWKKELFYYAVFHEYRLFFKKLFSSPKLYASPWCLALTRYFFRTKRPSDRI